MTQSLEAAVLEGLRFGAVTVTVVAKGFYVYSSNGEYEVLVRAVGTVLGVAV